MQPTAPLSVLAVAALCAASAAAARAGGCLPAWSAGGTLAGADGEVLALLPLAEAAPHPGALIAGGEFTAIGPVAASRIARWNGDFWLPLAGGMNGPVRALALFDPDGDGPAPALLIAAGEFTMAGGSPASNIASWDGLAWAALAGGTAGRINTLTVFKESAGGGTPPALFVGGFFQQAGGVPASNIARWDGAIWSPVAGGADNEVMGLASLDLEGHGQAALFVGGWFTQVDSLLARRVARWDGQSWSPLGDGLTGTFPVYARAFALFDPDGPGPEPVALYVGGIFENAGGVPATGLARWDGAAWHEVGGGIGFPAETRALIVFDEDGDGPAPERLYAAGSFLPVVGAPANNIAGWDGASWAALESGTNQRVSSLAAYRDDDDPDAPAALIVGGRFTTAGQVPTAALARWGCPRSPSPFCPDANGDGFVNFNDITSVLLHWGADYGSESPPTGPGDADGNGVVNFSDITVILSGWGADCR